VRREEGFSLVELLVVMTMLPIVLGATLMALDTGAKIAPKTIEYGNAVRGADAGVSRMVRELRQAYRVVGATPNAITFDAVYKGVDQRVSYQCDVDEPGGRDLRRCVRVAVAQGGALPALSTGMVVVDQLVNGTIADPVFSFAPNAITPGYVGVRALVAAKGERTAGQLHTMTITNGALLRNNVLGA
jgi:prepilin-type N-terminal cleavage/methylation domain-containing protein